MCATLGGKSVRKRRLATTVAATLQSIPPRTKLEHSFDFFLSFFELLGLYIFHKTQNKKHEKMEEHGLDMSAHLDKMYNLERLLGAGIQGIALLLKNRKTDHLVVLKILPKSKDILFKVQQAKEKYSIYQFVECYGMFVCSKFPRKWQNEIDRTIEEREKAEWEAYAREYSLQDYEGIYYCYLYEYGGETLKSWLQKEHTYDDLVNIIVSVLFFLLDLYTRHKIIYEDPQIQNICIQNKPDRIWNRTFDLDGKRYVYNYKTNQKIMFIDFDSVVFNIENRLGRIQNWDNWKMTMEEKSWNFFHQCVFQLYRTLGPVLSEREKEALHLRTLTYAFMENSNPDTVPKSILGHKDASQIGQLPLAIEPTTKKVKQMNCHICGNISTRALANRPSLTFCANDECVLKLGELVHMI